jgi:glutamate-5-semialdehyde dehydrogenase
MAGLRQLQHVWPGMPIVVGGDRVVELPAEIAQRFAAGDALAVVPETGEVLHVPARERALVQAALERARNAFSALGACSDAQLCRFFEEFAAALETHSVWEDIARRNAEDVSDARARGRSTTRLVADEKLRAGMIEGLRGWARMPSRRGQVLERIAHAGFAVELIADALGVVGFVFEGRPNVLADACGVIRSGNCVVLRIGSDALRTARAIVKGALDPALAAAGLPPGTATLLDSASHAAGWALFSDARLALAVARGSGAAVTALGSLARHAGVSVSMHGTGGAWLIAAPSARGDAFGAAVLASLDRKVCNTLNTCCVPRARAAELVPRLLESLAAAGARRGQAFKLHVVERDAAALPRELFARDIAVRRAEGDVREKQAQLLREDELGREWEWEETPEISVVLVDSTDEAIALFNRYSPRFIACLLSDDAAEHAHFYARVDAPFVGDGYTRWVDGQFALHRPELGLSSWQAGRLFSRGGILTGEGVYTVRTRYVGLPES